jgi:uncharacterized membrane protein YgdD (TMEM256/DUF423 family)
MSKMPTERTLLQYACVLGASGVALGAFGAHALKETLEKKGTQSYWNTAVLYQLVHAAVMLGIHDLSIQFMPIDRAVYRLSGKLLLAGVCCFSGSLYGLALEIGPKKILGPTTPVGGLLMIASWLVLGFKKR